MSVYVELSKTLIIEHSKIDDIYDYLLPPLRSSLSRLRERGRGKGVDY
jgi:hypothetical protein